MRAVKGSFLRLRIDLHGGMARGRPLRRGSAPRRKRQQKRKAHNQSHQDFRFVFTHSHPFFKSADCGHS